jgi:hypothetical protein
LHNRHSDGIATRGRAAHRILPRGTHPQRDEADPHDEVTERDAEVVALAERRRYARRENEDAAHLQQGEQAVGNIIRVVGGGEPGEVHPGPPDGEEHHQERHDRGKPGGRLDVSVERRRDLRDGDDEGQVEQQLERAGCAIALVRVARDHARADAKSRGVGHPLSIVIALYAR